MQTEQAQAEREFQSDYFSFGASQTARTDNIPLSNLLVNGLAARYEGVDEVKFQLEFHRYRDEPKFMYTNLDPIILHLIANADSKSMPYSLDRVYCISRWFATLIGGRAIPIQDLLLCLGYKLKDIETWFSAVKSKNLFLVLAGYGGSGVNLIHWCYEIVNYLGLSYLFKTICIHDSDAMEYHNLFRFPLPTTTNTQIRYKQTANPDYLFRLTKDRVERYDGYIINEYSGRLSQRTIKNMVIYGAPTIEYRARLKDIHRPFFCATHLNNEATLMLNPTVSPDMMIESYGKIDITNFFMNQLKMAVEFIKYLALTPMSAIPVTEEKTIGTYDFFADCNNIITSESTEELDVLPFEIHDPNIEVRIKHVKRYNFINIRGS